MHSQGDGYFVSSSGDKAQDTRRRPIGRNILWAGVREVERGRAALPSKRAFVNDRGRVDVIRDTSNWRYVFYIHSMFG